MGDCKERFIVTHTYASDPDPRKVEAALEVWKLALAEQIVAEDTKLAEPGAERPIATISVASRRRGRRARGSEGGLSR